jgi:predicted transcriptional regulator
MDQHPELYSIELECISFFEENLYTFETLEGLALRIGRQKEDLELVLNKLVDLAIVERIGIQGQPFVYRYIKPVESVI